MKIILTVRSSAPSTDKYRLAIKTVFYVVQSNRFDASCNIPDDLPKTLFMKTYDFVTHSNKNTHNLDHFQ